MRKVYVFVLLTFIATNNLFSQAFSGTYTFASVTTGSGTTDPTIVPTASGLTFGSFTATGTPANPNAAGRFSFTDWSLGATNGSDVFTGGITTSEYYEVTLTPSASFTIDLNTIIFTLQRSGTGIRQYSVRSSLDGFAANLPASISPANPNLSVVPTNIFQVTDASTGANTGSTITLDATYDNLTTPVTFRFYGWNAEGTGGTFSIDDVVFNGVATFTGSVTNFYSKPAGNLTDVTTWGNISDGSGIQPLNFTTDGQRFNVVNRVSATLDANWTVSGASSQVIVGDGLSVTTLILPVAAALTGVIDVSNLSTLQIVNSTLPTFGTLSSGSTVDYAQTAATYVVPTGTTYHHLKLTSNTKTFASGALSVNGNLTVDAVTGFNGGATPFTTLTLYGNFSLINSAAFEPIVTGDGNRMTLTCAGSGTQTLSGGNFYLFRLQSPAAGTVTIALSSANLTLGNASSGGLNLLQATHTLSIGAGNTLTIHRSGFFSGTNVGTLSGTVTSNLVIDKTTGGSGIGSIGFATGAQELNNFTYNSAGTGSNNLSLLTNLAAVGNLTMTAGLIDIGNNTLTVSGTATGVTTSYVKTSGTSGGLQLLGITTLRTVPVGNSTYNPLTIANGSNLDWTVRVEDVLTVDDPAFASNTAKAVKREWHIAPSTTPPPAGVDLVFQWNDSDPTQIGVSYNPAENVQIWREVSAGQPWGKDWIAVGVAQVAGGFPGPGVRTAFINGWQGFYPGVTPFAISNISGPLPVKLINFNVVKVSPTHSLLNWELAACCSSAARFVIEKSNDGNNFSVLTTLPGSETNRYYNYHDAGLGKGVTYYRLKMTDVDGKITYSKIVAIINDSKGLLITNIAPNPAADNATVSLSVAKPGTVSFTIYDISGRPVRKWQETIVEGSTTITINVAAFPAGIYHLAATSTDSKTVMRFVKQ